MRLRHVLVLTLINAMFVTPALAQCEQDYPSPTIASANCENYGAGNPYTSYGYLEMNANPEVPVANRRPFHYRQSTRGLEHRSERRLLHH